MKTIYTAIMAKLKSDIPALKFIDLDYGQLNIPAGQRPAVAFPCALIRVELPECRDITELTQDCKARITVRLAFDPLVRNTSSLANDEKRAEALTPYDTVSDVYDSLQGYETANFNALSRRSQGDERRTDGLFVYQIVFHCEFEDITAE